MADVLSATKQFKRLFKGPLDPSLSWDTLAELEEYLNDPTCPANLVVGAAGRAYITYIDDKGNMALSELGAIDETQFGQMASQLLKEKYDDVVVSTVTKEDGSIVSMIQFYANGVAVDEPIEVGGSSLTADQIDSLNRIDNAYETATEALDKAVTTEDKLLTYKDEVDEKLRQMQILINEANYKEITTTKYSVYPTNAEIGSIVDASLSWEYNKDIVTFQKMNGVELGINERSYTVTNISSNTPFKLEFSDGITDASKTISLAFLNSRCYGVSSTKTYDSELISTLTKVLTGSRACSFTVNSGDGQFIYYAIPTRFGKPTFYVGGFEGGFFLANTIDYTNPSGYTESYDIYRSDYSGLGDTTVVVK